jgi:hypothetical protein
MGEDFDLMTCVEHEQVPHGHWGGHGGRLEHGQGQERCVEHEQVPHGHWGWSDNAILLHIYIGIMGQNLDIIKVTSPIIFTNSEYVKILT